MLQDPNSHWWYDSRTDMMVPPRGYHKIDTPLASLRESKELCEDSHADIAVLGTKFLHQKFVAAFPNLPKTKGLLGALTKFEKWHFRNPKLYDHLYYLGDERNIIVHEDGREELKDPEYYRWALEQAFREIADSRPIFTSPSAEKVKSLEQENAQLRAEKATLVARTERLEKEMAEIKSFMKAMRNHQQSKRGRDDDESNGSSNKRQRHDD